MCDAPVLLNAPVAVNNAKLEVLPKVGATPTGGLTNPKFTFGIKNKITAVNIISNSSLNIRFGRTCKYDYKVAA